MSCSFPKPDPIFEFKCALQPVNMTTMEKLLLQIIDRKDSIIEKLQVQADSYTEQLASRLLIDGITPPPWLLSPRSSNPNGLEKEDIISKLLLRPPRYPTQYSNGGHSLYFPPVFAGGNINKQLSTEKCVETHVLNKAISLRNENVVAPECHNNDIVGSLDHVPEVDDSFKSPQNETDARITSNYSEHDLSLARIQRSKSRQKARELRTSGKATAKSCLSNETRTHLSFSGDSESRKDFCQVIQDKSPSENEHKELDSGIMVEPTGDSLVKSCRVNGDSEGVNLGNVCVESYASKKSTSGKTQGTQSQNNLCGRITRSRTSSQQTSGINKSLKGEGSVSRSAGDLMNEVSISNKLSDAAETSQVEPQAIHSNEGVLKPVISSYIDMKESTLGVDHQENAEIVVGNEPISEPIAMQPVNSGIMLDPVTLRQASDCCMNVKPKQLDFDVIEENESFSSHSKKRNLDGLLGKECSLAKSCQQLPKANVMSSSPETTRAHSLSPKEVDKVDKEMHSQKSHLNEDQASSLNMQTKEDDIELNGKESAAGVYIPELDEGAKSPQNETNARITSIYAAPDMSLARIQRSKSRQKARELRTGGKTTAKSYLSKETRTNGSDEIPSLQNEHKELDGGEFSHMHEVSISNKLSDAAKTSQAICSNEGVLKPDISSYTDIKESTLGEVVVGNEPVAMQPVNSGIKLDTLNLRQSSDCCENAKPKQLNFDEIDERDSNEISSLLSKKRKLDGYSYNKIDDIGVTHELNLSPKEVDDKFDKVHSEMSHLNEDQTSLINMQTKEDNAGDGHIPVSNIKSSITSSLTKQGNKGSEDCLDKEVNKPDVDLDSSKSKDFELRTNPKLSNTKLNSAKANTWPFNQQKNVEDQLNCFSDSRNFRVHFQRDAIHCNLETLLTQSDGDTRDHDEVACDLLGGTESLVKIQAAAEEAVTTDMLKQAEPICALNLMKDAADDSIDNGDVYKGNNESGIEQICKSASMQTPLPEFSSSFEHHQVQDLYDFIADEILDEGSKKNLQISDTGITKIDSPFPLQQKLDYSTPFYLQPKNHYSSPVGKLWERSYSSSGSSEVHLSSNPDLTCFPIEEDPCSNEENDDDVAAAEIQQPHIEPHVSTSSKKHTDKFRSNSVSIEASVPRTREVVKQKPKIPHGSKVSRYNEDNRNSSIATRASCKGNVSVSGKIKSSMRSRIPRLSEKEAKRNNNIVSNITSFIPLVQQKQAAAVNTGKRNIKVKALEDAEAAKRLEQEKENERKLRKEALKLKRERIGKENAKEMEIKLKRQEELKKKEADTRKRQREEEERKQLVKKRKPEAQKNQKLKCEKSRVKNAAMVGTKKNSENLRQNKNAAESSFQKQDIDLTNVVQEVTYVSENHDVPNDCGEKDKATSLHETSPVKVVPEKFSQENSYDISPYQCSDDEDDDDLPTKKFVPSWASKNRMAIVVPSQQKLDPISIFPVDSFCSIDEVLLPRRLQAQ